MSPYTPRIELLEELDITYPPCGFHVGHGWLPIVRRALTRLIAAGWDRRLAQVKQKFLGLRIYLESTTPEFEQIIAEASREAWQTCETCGGSYPHSLGVGRAECSACKSGRA